MDADIKFKICLFGDFAVGKTTLATRYLTNLFHKNMRITLGMEIHVKDLEVEGKKINLQIWDFGGQRQFRYLLPAYARGAFGSIYMYDITNKESVEEIGPWLEAYHEGLREDDSQVPRLLVGGKADLKDQRQITKKQAKKLKEKYGFWDLMECSSITGENVEEIFSRLVREIMKLRGFL